MPRRAARLIERAPWLPPKTSRQRSSGEIDEALAGSGAVRRNDLGRNRTAGDQVLLSGPPGDREGEADAPCAAGENAVGETEVAVGLGQDQRQAAHDRRQPRRPGDVAAAAEHRLGAALAQHPARGGDRAQRQRERAGGANGVLAVETAKLEQLDLIARRGHELGLGAVVRADEEDLGALSA